MVPAKLLPTKFNFVTTLLVQTTRFQVHTLESGIPRVHFQPLVSWAFEVKAAAKSHIKDTSPDVVGACVGNNVVGLNVGLLVGWPVGTVVGKLDGRQEGCPDGAAEGAVLGILVG